ncbi:MAG: MmgE/PrpD family protein [Candidatus Bathyarchaeia archaeon]
MTQNISQPYLAESLANFAYETRFNDLPPEVVRRVKIFTLDIVGAALAGSMATLAKEETRRLLAKGARPESTIIGSQEKTIAEWASHLNGFQSELFDWTPDYLQLGHPSFSTIPPTLAVAEREKVDGKTFLTSVAVGYEIECRLLDSYQSMFIRPEHLEASIGAFGGAVGAAKEMGLSKEQMTQTIAHAAYGGHWTLLGSLWSAIKYHGGGGIKVLVSTNDVEMADYAKMGITLPHQIFEGKLGYFEERAKRYGGKPHSHERVREGLGKEWRMLLACYKPYPNTCNPMQGQVEVTLDLMKEDQIRPADVDKVFVRISGAGQNYSFAKPIKYKPPTWIMCGFSTPYLVGVSILKGRLTPAEFTDEVRTDPRVLDMVARVDGVEDEEFSKRWLKDMSKIPIEITIWTKDGRKHSKYLDIPMGEPHSPKWNGDINKWYKAIEDKFRTIAEDIPSYRKDADKIVDTAMNLEKLKNIKQFTKLLQKKTPTRYTINKGR